MTISFAVKTTIEVIAVLFLIWGFINEEKFIAFEDKFLRAVGIHIRNRRRRKAAEQRCKQQKHRCAQQCAQESVCAAVPMPKPEAVKKNPVFTDYNVA